MHKPAAERVTKRCVCHDARTLEEASRAHSLRAIDDLRWQRERSWWDVLTQRPDRAKGEDRTYAERLERGYIRAEGDGRWAEGMS
jgi:hypothetical protein